MVARDAGAVLIICDSNTVQKAAGLKLTMWELPSTPGQAFALGLTAAIQAGRPPAHLSYIIYTSGTTGQPKGVELSHRAVAHFVCSEKIIMAITPQDRVWHGLSLAFDASVEELWLAWANGAQLVIGSTAEMQDTESLSALMTQRGVTVFSTVPTMLSMLAGALPSVRILITGGESVSQALVDRWAPGRLFINTYGPTEAAVVVTWTTLQAHCPVTIGRPLPHVKLHILDLETGEAAEHGELWLSGPMLADGYTGNPLLTAEKFPQHPHWGRCYRTGDLVRRNTNQELEFLGRIDGQVKLRGYRLELEEVEAQLIEVSGGRAAAAVIQKDRTGQDRLVAFIVGPGHGESSMWIDALRLRLPAYMVPSRIQKLEFLPVSASGKLHRAALPQMETETGAKDLESLWRASLALPPETPLDEQADFFHHLGGASLSGAWLVSNLRKLPGWENLSVAQLYQYPTLGELRTLQQSTHVGELHPSDTKTNLTAAWKHSLCGLTQLATLPFLFCLRALPWIWFAGVVISVGNGLTSALGWLGAGFLFYGVPQIRMALAAGSKWLILGKVTAGDYPLWGVFYYRFWLASRLVEHFSPESIAGTPFASKMLRWLGGKVGAGCHVGSQAMVTADLVEMGDHCIIQTDAHLHPHTVEQGLLRLRKIQIGAHSHIGTRSYVGGGTIIPVGSHLPAGQHWDEAPHSSEASVSTENPPHTRSAPPAKFLAAYAALSLPFVAAGWAVVVVSYLCLPAWWDAVGEAVGLAWLATNPLHAAVAAMAMMLASLGVFIGCVAVAFRIVSFSSNTQEIPRGGWDEVRLWFVQSLWRVSAAPVFPLLASVFASPLLRLFGAKIGRRVEVSTVEHIDPQRIDLANGSFVADAVSLGAPLYEPHRIVMPGARVGERTFLGNNSIIPAQHSVGDHSLLGVLSLADPSMSQKTGSWLGAPAFSLRQREKAPVFDKAKTYEPGKLSILARGIVEAARCLIPGTLMTLVVLAFVSMLGDTESVFLLALALTFGLAIVAPLFVILTKWMIVGEIKPGVHPLWSFAVWRLELIACWHEWLSWPAGVQLLSGTPFLPWYYRVLGAKFGRQVYCETRFLTEFDLIAVGDAAALNYHCDPQSHLFEDRILKCGRVRIESHASLGSFSVVLPDSVMHEHSTLAPQSLLMKGESLPEGTRWSGVPARRCHADFPTTEAS
jgi:non-ribosomal peptide synthetase-like protein